jgi:hypothetical protein
MAQVFSPGTVLTLKALLIGLPLLAAAGVLTWRIGLITGPAVGEPLEQPVPFSHKHHVGEEGLDCRYCHTGVETLAYAGMPSTGICMTCHSQLFTDQQMLRPVRESQASGEPIKWRRVHDLPEFVFFNHSIHVHKGVGCETCHGRVDQMPLTWKEHSLDMQWCLECHRHPERYLRPREHVFDMDWRPQSDQESLGGKLVALYQVQTDRLMDCSVCHR